MFFELMKKGDVVGILRSQIEVLDDGLTYTKD